MSTFIHNNCEFVFPGLFKVYPTEWSQDFLKYGKLFFTNIEVFKRDPSCERGDSMEGTSISIRNGVKCTGSYMNPIFVWCCSMETDISVLMGIWKDRDSVLQITNTLKFIERVEEYSRKFKLAGPLHVGPVTYDKDDGSYRDYHWVEGVFQKNYKHNNQKEFRLSLTGDTSLEKEEHLILELGDCNDIARIITKQHS